MNNEPQFDGFPFVKKAKNGAFYGHTGILWEQIKKPFDTK